MAKLPAIQFYVGDWLKDPKLSMCSPSTRGIWMDLICAMHELDRTGVITGTPDQLCRLSRCSAVEMSAAVAELKATDAAIVTERNGNVTLINRRMNAEHKERLAGNERVKKYRSNGNETDLKRESNTPSSSSASSSVSKTSAAANGTNPRAREGLPDDAADGEKNLNGGAARSRFTEETCREYVDALVADGRDDIKNPGGLAHSIFISGKSDRDIQAWIDSGKTIGAKKRKAVIPG